MLCGADVADGLVVRVGVVSCRDLAGSAKVWALGLIPQMSHPGCGDGQAERNEEDGDRASSARSPSLRARHSHALMTTRRR